VRVGSSSDDVGTRQYCQMVRVRLAGPEGTARANQWLTSRKRSTGSNLADMGRDAVRGFRFAGKPTPVPCVLNGAEATPNVCGVGVAMLPG
jgi:hypothetical protein